MSQGLWGGGGEQEPVLARLSSALPFVGREAELRFLADAIGSPRAPQEWPRGAVVSAPVGKGKTRLAREASANARRIGFTTYWAVGTAAASRIPYAALGHWAPRVSPGNYTDAISFHAAFIAALAPDDGSVPLLVVDDAHLLDAGSAALLLRIALTGTGVLLLTLRPGETVPDPIARLWRDGLTHRLDVQPLRREDAERFLRTALGGAIAEPVLHRLYEVTGGNPLHIREFLLGAVESGSLTNRDGVWSWDGEVPLPTRLVDAIGERLKGFSEAERTTLALLSLGEPLEERLAERVCDPQALAALSRSGLVRKLPASSGASAVYRLGHPLLGEVALAALGPDRGRELLLRLADVSSRQLLDGAARMRLAGWQLAAGQLPDPVSLVDAAEYANSLFAHDEALRLGLAALEQTADVRATVVVATALNGLGRYPEGAERLAEVEESAFVDERPAVRLEYLERRVMALFHGLGEDDEAAALLERFRERCTDPDSRRLDSALRAMMEHEAGSHRVAAERAMEVLEDPEAAEATLVIAGEVAGEAFELMGEPERSRAVQSMLRELAAQGGPLAPRIRRAVGLQELYCKLQEGRLREVEELIHADHERWVPGHDDVGVGLATFGLGIMHLLRGRPGRALDDFKEADACLQRADMDGNRAWVLAIQAQAEARLGRGEVARKTLARACELPIAGVRSRARLDFVLAEVLVSAAIGDATKAVRTALERADEFGELPVHRARLLHTALRLGAPAKTVAPLLADCADACSSPFPALLADHAAALAAQRAAELELVSQRFESCGFRLEAAESAAEAARLWHAGPAADRSRARAARLAAECEGVGMTNLEAVDQVPLLTRREREVAQLVAAGLSSRAIAERLVLSVRTVESHLYQVFAKLGVRRRDEIASLLGMDRKIQ